jgi:choline dehydrogenase-like flavoprotein
MAIGPNADVVTASNRVVDPRECRSQRRNRDASIRPSITGGNTNAPCYMIGERASDFILDRV